MEKTYKISGMTCDGCRNHVEQTLEQVEGVKSVKVNLEEHEAVLELDESISFDLLKNAMVADGGHYQIYEGDIDHESLTQISMPRGEGTGIFYCPMRCEGDKTYDEPGDCPVCGMDLVEEVSVTSLGTDNFLENKTYKKLLGKFWIALAFTLPIFVISMSEMIPGNPLFTWMSIRYWNWVQLGLTIPVVHATWMFFERAYRSVVTWKLNMWTLIGLGATAALLFSVLGIIFPGFFPKQFLTGEGTVHVYFEAATVILTLVLLGQVLESRAHSKTNSVIKELLKLAPKQATRINGDTPELIEYDKVQVGDLLRVKPGESVPVDGKILEGVTFIDESMVTGEPVPVSKLAGDMVISGTINGNQSFVMKAEKVGADTMLSQIIDLVNKASSSKAPIQRLADRISGYFVPTVVFVAAITFILWAIFGPEPQYVYAFVNAVAVLIIACPCALGLATPMSVMVGVGRGAREGILIRHAEALEMLNNVEVLAVDKTGTLTEGRPSVEEVVSINSNFDSEKVLEFVASLNQLSEHPLAEATVRFANEKGISIKNPKDFKSVTGKGVRGIVQSKEVLIGNDRILNTAQISVPIKVMKVVKEVQKQGKTVTYVAVDGEVIGYLIISDAIKETTKEAIHSLTNTGVEVVMLTGDNPYTAQYIASSLGIKSFKAGMSPEDKLKQVKELQAVGKKVAFAGDGINDSPALAQSDVGIAMGTGTDVAIESAGITLVKGDLQGIIKARELSKRVMRTIRQNLFFALAYNTIGIPIAAGLLFPFFGVLLSPMIGAAAMSLSSVSVIGNSLRLRK